MENFKQKFWDETLNFSVLDFFIWDFFSYLSYGSLTAVTLKRETWRKLQSVTDSIATTANQKVSRWQFPHTELYYWSRPESRNMHKPPYTNSSDRKSADPENQFKVTCLNISLRNWPTDGWSENVSPEVSAFQSTVDSFSQWRQLINYLAWIMMDYQKLSSNYYLDAELC